MAYYQIRGPDKEFLTSKEAADYLTVSEEFFEGTIAPAFPWMQEVRMAHRVKRWSSEHLAIVRYILQLQGALAGADQPSPETPDAKKK